MGADLRASQEPGTRQQGRARRALAAVPPVLGAGAVLAGDGIFLAAGALARATGRLAAHVWRRLGPSGRLVAAMVLAWPLAELAQHLEALPDGSLVTLMAAGSAIAACAGWLYALRWLGRRRWRAAGGRALAGGFRDDGRCAGCRALEARVDEILSLMAATSVANGIPVTAPRLTLVRGELHHEAG
jgi:hypothetical protein